jgi:hypothetical protein
MENDMNENGNKHQAFVEYLDQFRRVLLRLEMAHVTEHQEAYDEVRRTVMHMVDELPTNIESPIFTNGRHSRKEWLGL